MTNNMKVLEMIIEDCENDARVLDGQPFNGKTIAEQLGNILAMVQKLAEIVNDIEKRTTSL